MSFFELKKAPTSSKKKWCVRLPSTGRGRTVCFGALGYEDYTQHKDKARRENYRSRHRNDRLEDPYSPGFWSWYVLWGESTDRRKNFQTAVRLAKRLLAKRNPSAPGDVVDEVDYENYPREIGNKNVSLYRSKKPQWVKNYGKKRPQYVATVVNPVTLRPYFVYTDSELFEALLVVPSFGKRLELVGAGELDNAVYPPETHTPSGVYRRGEGLGTALYAGLSAVAAMSGAAEVQTGGGAQGWWRAAAERGLAYADEEARDEEFDLYDVHVDALEALEGGVEDALRIAAEEYVDGEYAGLQIDAVHIEDYTVYDDIDVDISYTDADGDEDVYTVAVSAGDTFDLEAAEQALIDEGIHYDVVTGFDASGYVTVQASFRAEVLASAYRLPFDTVVERLLVIHVNEDSEAESAFHAAASNPSWTHNAKQLLAQLDLSEIVDKNALRFFEELREEYSVPGVRQNPRHDLFKDLKDLP